MKIKLVVEENDSYVWKMTKKTTQKTSTHTSDDRAHQVAFCSTSKTTEGLPVRQFAPKKAVVDVTPARVSGQLANIFITKPQQVYTSVGIRDQNTPRCTGPINQWERSVGKRREALRLAGQLGVTDGDRDYNQEKSRFRPSGEPK